MFSIFKKIRELQYEVDNLRSSVAFLKNQSNIDQNEKVKNFEKAAANALSELITRFTTESTQAKRDTNFANSASVHLSHFDSHINALLINFGTIVKFEVDKQVKEILKSSEMIDNIVKSINDKQLN